ncbi:hypothetical protein HY933_01065 [Candidatus Falkowbacteria bacterium]|nr:hypothetical protein [Candidatus Falkowbacteria bacterium]
MIAPRIRAALYLPHPAKGERIEFILRRHSLTLLVTTLGYLVLLIVPWVFRWFMEQNFTDFWRHPFFSEIIYLGGSVYVLFIVLFFFTSFIDYWLDVWVVTSERIIGMEQKGIFSRTFAEQRLDQLQDVSSEVQGFFPTVFHYGNVMAQAAGTQQNAVFKEVPHADMVARRIMELMEESRRKQQGK